MRNDKKIVKMAKCGQRLTFVFVSVSDDSIRDFRFLSFVRDLDEFGDQFKFNCCNTFVVAHKDTSDSIHSCAIH